MIRYFIHVGDKTTSGCTVIDGAASTFGFGGQPLAVEGAHIQCPKCNNIGVGVKWRNDGYMEPSVCRAFVKTVMTLRTSGVGCRPALRTSRLFRC